MVLEKFAEDFDQKKEDQLAMLYKQIVGDSKPTGHGKFNVYPIEASLGKTNTMINALVDLYQKHPDTKTLVVTIFNKEIERIATKINIKAKREIAVGLTYKNYDYLEPHIEDAPIVIISHQRYKRLCRSGFSDTWMKYALNRQNLIVDEECDILTKTSISHSDFYAFLHILKDYNAEMVPIVNRIIDQLQESPRYSMRFLHNIVEEDNIRELKNYLREKSESRMFVQFRSEVEIILTKNSIVDRDGIHAFRNVPYLSLQNNIILDASASVNRAYEAEPYAVINLPRIQDHSHWKVRWWNESSNPGKKNDNFYIRITKFIAEDIKENTKNPKRILILCKKDEKEKVKKLLYNDGIYIDESNITNFWSMKGKNDWGKCNQCYIIHTPTEPYVNYVFRYLSLHPDVELQDDDLKIVESRFVNDDIEHYRSAYLSGLLYQGMKRINRRSMQEPTEILLVIDDEMIAKNAAHELSNIAGKKIKADVINRNKTKRQYSQRKFEFAEGFIEILEEILVQPRSEDRNVPKSYFKEKLHYTHFGREIMKNEQVKEYLKKHHEEIIPQNHFFLFKGNIK